MTYIWRCDIQESITMGGGKGGGSQNTTTTTQAPPAWLQSAYQQLLPQAQAAAATPYTPYPGQIVAPTNANENTAINTVAGAQGGMQPYTNAATSATLHGSQTVMPQLQQYNQANLSQYQDPYTQDVINATMARANQQDATQQSQLMGQGIAAGASPFGGDRAGVAAGVLAGQQALANNQTIAGLNNQNYTQAQAELNNQQQLQANTMASDAWRQLSAGQMLSGIGNTQQTDTLAQANAQLGAGQVQQNLAQAQLNVPYQQYQAAQAYPFQSLGWLGNLESGLGGVSGGTASTTAPAPSTASGILGLGTTVFGAAGQAGGFGNLFKRGGVAGNHYAYGGIPDVSVDYIPQLNMNTHGNLPSAPKPDSSSGAGSALSPSGLGNVIKGASSLFGSGSPSGDSGGISPAASSVFSSNAGGSFGGDTAMASQLANNANFMGSGTASTGINFKKGGIASHYDAGGMITNPMQEQIAGANPMMQKQASQYAQMPVDKLQQLATMQTNNPLIQRALRQKQMGAGGMGAPTMASVGVMPHYDDGGSTPAEQVLQDIANEPSGVASGNPVAAIQSNPQGNGIGAVNASDLLPPDAKGVAAPVRTTDTPIERPPSQTGELDNQPIVDSSGDTHVIHYPSEKKSVDTGIPSFKDTGPASSPWEAVTAAGLAMMAGKSPYALQNIGAGGLEGLNVLGQQRAAALKENQAQTEAQKLQDDLDLRRQQMNQTMAHQGWEEKHGNAELAQQDKLRIAQMAQTSTEQQQRLDMQRQLAGLPPLGAGTGIMAPSVDQTPSSDPQQAAAQILAEAGTVPAQAISRQDQSGRNTQTTAYNNTALAAKTVIQQLDSLDAQTGKYTPGKVANLGYGAESAISMGGEGATARTEADKASKNLANAFMQANSGSRGSGVRMVEFDAGAVPNADMPDAARTELIAKNKAVANQQIQRAAISNLYPRMQIANINAIMDNYETKNPPILSTGSPNPNWMTYKDWLASGRPNTELQALQGGTKNQQPAAGQTAQPQYQEGQTATGANGQKIVFKNGQWGAQ